MNLWMGAMAKWVVYGYIIILVFLPACVGALFLLGGYYLLGGLLVVGNYIPVFFLIRGFLGRGNNR